MFSLTLRTTGNRYGPSQIQQIDHTPLTCTFFSSSAYNMPSFEAGAQLLSSLTGYAYTKRAWRKEVFELFMDPLFFTMDPSCAPKLVCLYIR